MVKEELKKEELKRFKNLLQYFLLHLEYNNHEKSKKDGEISTEFEWPTVDEKIKNNIIDGKKAGQGYNGDTIQDQIKDWCYYHVGKICISVQYSKGGGYTSKASYLHWPGTALNIIAEWNNKEEGKVRKIKYLYYQNVDDVNDVDNIDSGRPKFLIQRDDLFGMNEHLEQLYSKYMTVKEEFLNRLLEKSHNIILTGAPGTGKTFLAKQIAKLAGAKGESCGFVQFHPSYDYTDFVEGLRPVNKGEQIEFQRKDGVFLAFCRNALKAQKKAKKKGDSQPMYVFIIDEINRGEISKIFGELFFSIDNGYRGEDGLISTQYSNLWEQKDIYDSDLSEEIDKKKFYVPDNVYIIGTMNDIDRSVESLDFAFRRRFTFHEISAEDSVRIIYSADSKDGWDFQKRQDAVCRMMALNNAIIDNDKGGLTEQYQIGGAYFLKLKDVGFDFDRLWNEYLRGTLFEYFRGLPNKEIKKKIESLYKAYKGENKDQENDDKGDKGEDNGEQK